MKGNCKHCGQQITRHGRFARCPSGETQFTPKDAGACAYGNCQNKVAENLRYPGRDYCDECMEETGR